MAFDGSDCLSGRRPVARYVIRGPVYTSFKKSCKIIQITLENHSDTYFKVAKTTDSDSDSDSEQCLG